MRTKKKFFRELRNMIEIKKIILENSQIKDTKNYFYKKLPHCKGQKLISVKIKVLTKTFFLKWIQSKLERGVYILDSKHKFMKGKMIHTDNLLIEESASPSSLFFPNSADKFYVLNMQHCALKLVVLKLDFCAHLII